MTTKSSEPSFVRFQCPCGAQLRAGKKFAGSKELCPKCRRPVVVPLPSSSRSIAESRDILNAELVEGTCGICQSIIIESESVKICEACQLPYHSECWSENLGCGAYGCRNVNVERMGPDIRITAPAVSARYQPPALSETPSHYPDSTIAWAGARDRATDNDAIPWEYAILAASVVCAVMSLFTCGVPALLIETLA